MAAGIKTCQRCFGWKQLDGFPGTMRQATPVPEKFAVMPPVQPQVDLPPASAPAVIVQCIHCGMQHTLTPDIPVDRAICVSCHLPLLQQPQQYGYQAGPPVEQSSANLTFLVIIGIFFPFIGIIIGAVMGASSDPVSRQGGQKVLNASLISLAISVCLGVAFMFLLAMVSS